VKINEFKNFNGYSYNRGRRRSVFGGMKYQQSKVGSFAGGQSGAFRQRMGQGQSAAPRPVRGEY